MSSNDQRFLRAAARGQAKAVSHYLASGVPVDAEDEHRYTALSHASMNGRAEVVGLLLDAGADIDHRDREKATPLIWASINKHAAVAAALVARGARLGLKDGEGNAALHEACAGNIGPGSLEIVKQLIDNGADAEILNRDRETPLQVASSGGLEDVVRHLAGLGADVNHVNRHGFTPLVQAMRGNHPRVVEALLDLGADPGLSGERFAAAVKEITSYGFTGVVEVLGRREALRGS